MNQQTKFGKGTTLRQALDEFKENGLIEITRVMDRDRVFTFEYSIK